MKITGLSLGPLGTNCYIIQQDSEALIIDPGGNPEAIERFLNENKLTPVAILLTHAHFDHIGAVDAIRKSYNIDVYLHDQEADWLEDPALNRSEKFMGQGNGIVTKRPEHLLDTGKIKIGPFQFEVVHTPGHSPGSVTFIFHDDAFIVSGDVLFHQGIGRTDIPGGSLDILAQSILNELYTLPDHFEVYPGHGISTSIGAEKVNNPYTRQF